MAFGRALNLPNVTLSIAEFVPNGTNLTFPDNVCLRMIIGTFTI